METTTTFTLENGKIVETTINAIIHDPQTYLGNLESEKQNTIVGRDNYLADVNGRIATIQSKIDQINNLINPQP